MTQFTRTKKLTNYVYSPTDPASEDAIRLQVDNSIQEVADILYSQDAGKGASQVGINGLAYATVQDLAQVVSDSGTGTAPPALSVGNAQLATDVKVGSLATLLTTVTSSVVGAINELVSSISGVLSTVNNSNAIKFYGKQSKMSGGSQVIANGVQSTTSFVTFSAEVVDDFNAINIGVNPTRFTISSGITKVVFKGIITYFVRGYAGSGKVTVSLFKNNSLVSVISEFGVVPTASAYTDIYNTCDLETEIISCALNDYFEIKVTSASTSANSQAYFSSGSVFKMEVLG